MGHRHGKVLIVDDDRVVLEVTSEWLRRAGYTVVVRQSALGTAADIHHEHPDVVLLDINMPALSGPKLATLIAGNAKLSATRVIFFSSDPLEETQSLARQHGALGAIRKTPDERQFITAFEHLLDSSDGPLSRRGPS